MAKAVHKVDVAEVWLWDRKVGAVAWDEKKNLARFEYAPGFLAQGWPIAPLTVPLRPGIFAFPELSRGTYHGLPGLLADSLPDHYGQMLIELWLQRHGRDPKSFSPVERLCYMGHRAMGALEFRPASYIGDDNNEPVQVAALRQLAVEALTKKGKLNTKLHTPNAIETIFRLGTSAGGARAKAVIAWNPSTGEVRAGDVALSLGFEAWILKFDGIGDNGDLGPEGRPGFGKVEYVYHQMALDAGLEMSECRLEEENGRAHFMTHRFDRTKTGDKLHMLSLCAMDHLDFNDPGSTSYETGLRVIRELGLGAQATKQFLLRMMFNVVARNQDDHTRNIAFLMDENGAWRLSPAFDVMWALNPKGTWTREHQMSINGKRGGFETEDLLRVCKAQGLKSGRALLDQVTEAVSQWPKRAKAVGVRQDLIEAIGESHLLKWARSERAKTQL